MTTSAPHLSHPKYRPDIDGLRAIAVLSVVLFHAFPSWVKGGFVGVDVFFVISGFLISSIIFENLNNGTFKLSEFYARRIKRIFPALVVVLAGCMAIGWLMLLPEELNQLGKHVFSGAGFISNLVLWGEAGYFDNSADTKPLLHLWSLGIEEQFYIAWPLLVWAVWRRNSGPVLLTSLLLVGSFVLNIYYVDKDPVAAFYSPLTRVWELLFGSLLALYVAKTAKGVGGCYDTCSRSLMLSNCLALCGILLLICGFAFINKDSRFPGYWALVPVVGATMLICTGSTAWLNRTVLSSKVLVWFGLISFPLYLWHWPLLSFGRIVYFDQPPLGYRVAAVACSICLAWLTMRYIERPFRYGSHTSSFGVLGLSGALAVTALLGCILFISNFSDSRSFENLSFKRRGEHAIGSSLYWYRGKDGWLFLGNAYEKTVAKLKLAIRPEESSIREIASQFSKVSEFGASHGIRTFLILGPDKSSIYPEYLPGEVVPSETRYSSFFLDRLREISSLTVYDPTSDLIAAKKSEGLLYWRTDTHWNNKGAYVAFAGFARLANVGLPEVSFAPGSPHSGDLIGISGLRDFPLDRGDSWDIVWAGRPLWAEEVIPNERRTTFGASTLVTNEKPLSGLYVWVVGDSFAGALKQYFNATFHKVRYVGHWGQKIGKLSEAINKAERKPDLIVIVRVERSF